MNERRADAAVATALFAAKLGLSIALVELAGFRHVSDDDYARTVIAQSFAAAPKLDPSGTSWLPVPFWLTGAAMIAFGRSLATARAAAYLASALATAGFFVALRAAGAGRIVATAATAFAALGTWSLWLGAATVPEGFTGALIAIGALCMLHPDRGGKRPALIAGALVLFAAGLSRYEAWAACVAFSAVALPSAIRGRRAAGFAVALLPLGAPLAWMAWNAHAHGDALHFLARVSRYREAFGAAGAPLGERLLFYPAALGRAFPEIVVAVVPAAYALVRTPRRLAPLAIAIAAVLAFLIIGELGEGAPTHHPERALGGVAFLIAALTAFGVERAWAARTETSGRVVLAAAGLALVILVTRGRTTASDYPGQGEADRHAQVERGRALRNEAAGGFTVEPCAYEHFALIASYGAPERVTVRKTPAPGAKAAVTETCPMVELLR